jgi:isocitrate/isopropylmalate dehydrogenase
MTKEEIETIIREAFKAANESIVYRVSYIDHKNKFYSKVI